MLPPTERFSSRADDYQKHRPSYPHGVIETLVRECGLGPSAMVADVGSGTGIFTRLLLEMGAEVFAIEPNEAMRRFAESSLGSEPRFHSIEGTAERTGLEDASVQLVTSAQAFHWFDAPAAMAEFRRILRPGGHIALVWNERASDHDSFHVGYEKLLRDLAEEYHMVRHREREAGEVESYFGERGCRVWTFPYFQEVDWDGWLGRVMSSSYAPQAGHPAHEEFVAGLRRLFDESNRNDKVRLEYQTKLYIGSI
jgi:SAM-dependent methyltransferase